MASSEALAVRRAEAVARRAAALAQLAEAAGIDPPHERRGKFGTPELATAEVEVSAWLVEHVLRQQREIDELRAGKKGAKS